MFLERQWSGPLVPDCSLCRRDTDSGRRAAEGTAEAERLELEAAQTRAEAARVAAAAARREEETDRREGDRAAARRRTATDDQEAERLELAAAKTRAERLRIEAESEASEDYLRLSPREQGRNRALWQGVDLSMNDTVAVALVTGGSTLLASATSGWLAMRAVGRQAALQLRTAREDRVESRAAGQREIRRELYRRFLQQATDAAKCVFALRPSTQLAREEFEPAARQAREAIGELSAVEALIMLEGPQEMTDAAEKVINALRYEHSAARALHLDKGSKQWQSYEEAFAQRIQSLRDLATSARAALGADISTS
ncbi:hypothetical protein ACFWGI_17005 [Streptomyces niveus]|uniref:hypothetical protein n=1 Tax=Streptomyces niveus TaxID=193462 RepID=UPI003654AFD4